MLIYYMEYYTFSSLSFFLILDFNICLGWPVSQKYFPGCTENRFQMLILKIFLFVTTFRIWLTFNVVVIFFFFTLNGNDFHVGDRFHICNGLPTFDHF